MPQNTKHILWVSNQDRSIGACVIWLIPPTEWGIQLALYKSVARLTLAHHTRSISISRNGILISFIGAASQMGMCTVSVVLGRARLLIDFD